MGISTLERTWISSYRTWYMVLKNRAFSYPISCLCPLSGGMRRTRGKDRLFFFFKMLKFYEHANIKTYQDKLWFDYWKSTLYFQIPDHKIDMGGKPTLKPTIWGWFIPSICYVGFWDTWILVAAVWSKLAPRTLQWRCFMVEISNWSYTNETNNDITVIPHHQ